MKTYWRTERGSHLYEAIIAPDGLLLTDFEQPHGPRFGRGVSLELFEEGVDWDEVRRRHGDDVLKEIREAVTEMLGARPADEDPASYVSIAACRICRALANGESADLARGEALPSAAASLRTVTPVTPFQHDCIRRCTGCGTYYAYDYRYEYFVNGSDEDESLTRLEPTIAHDRLEKAAPAEAAALTERWAAVIAGLDATLACDLPALQIHAAGALLLDRVERGDWDGVRALLSHATKEVRFGAAAAVAHVPVDALISFFPAVANCLEDESVGDAAMWALARHGAELRPFLPELARRLKPACKGYDHVAGALLRIVEPLLEAKRHEPTGLEKHIAPLVEALMARETDATPDNREGPYRALQLAAGESAAAAKEMVGLLESKERLGAVARRVLRMAKRRLGTRDIP